MCGSFPQSMHGCPNARVPFSTTHGAAWPGAMEKGHQRTIFLWDRLQECLMENNVKKPEQGTKEFPDWSHCKDIATPDCTLNQVRHGSKRQTTCPLFLRINLDCWDTDWAAKHHNAATYLACGAQVVLTAWNTQKTLCTRTPDLFPSFSCFALHRALWNNIVAFTNQSLPCCN